MSLNKDSSDEIEKEQDCRDKKEWMSSVQLWKTDDFQNTQIKTKVDKDQTNSLMFLYYLSGNETVKGLFVCGFCEIITNSIRGNVTEEFFCFLFCLIEK